MKEQDEMSAEYPALRPESCPVKCVREGEKETVVVVVRGGTGLTGDVLVSQQWLFAGSARLDVPLIRYHRSMIPQAPITVSGRKVASTHHAAQKHCLLALSSIAQCEHNVAFCTARTLQCPLFSSWGAL